MRHTKICEADLLTFRTKIAMILLFLTDYKNKDLYYAQLFFFSELFTTVPKNRPKNNITFKTADFYMLQHFVEISCFELWTVCRQF